MLPLSSDGKEHSARPAEQVPVELAGLADRRRVDDRHHLLDVVDQQPVEQGLVAVVQADQEDVPLEIVRLSPVVLHGAHRLHLHRVDSRREKPAQTSSSLS